MRWHSPGFCSLLATLCSLWYEENSKFGYRPLGDLLCHEKSIGKVGSAGGCACGTSTCFSSSRNTAAWPRPLRSLESLPPPCQKQLLILNTGSACNSWTE